MLATTARKHEKSLMSFSCRRVFVAAFEITQDPLKCCDGIDRRTGAAHHRNGRHRQQEIPSLTRGRRLAERFEIAVVEQVDAQVEQREVVRGGRDGRRRHVLRVIAAHDCDVPLLQPRNDRRIEPRVFRIAAACVRASRFSERPHARADKQGIAGPHFHPGLLLPGLQIFHVDRRALFQIRYALQARDVDEDAACEDPALEIVNRSRAGESGELVPGRGF